MKIAILDAATFCFEDDTPWEPLREFGELVIHQHTKYNPEAILENSREADVVLTNKVPHSREVMAQMPALKLVSVLATGYNIIDTEAAREQGVTVCNAPSYSTASVAQHTLALMLELCNHVGLHTQSVHAGDWTRSLEFSYWHKPLIEFSELTVGFVGWGEIARAAGKLVHALGGNVVAYSPSRRNAPDWQPFAWREVNEIFATADIVSLHCPLTRENTGMVNRTRLASMKSSAFLINTARGALIDEPALAEALHEGTIAGAALDVVAKEPMLSNNPLLGAPNCFITPHVAWSSLPARLRLLDITLANLRAFQDGAPQNVVS